MARNIILSLTIAVLAVACGCSERKMVITSEPSGALVVVNQTWQGKTPFTLPFKHHGTYDIRLFMDGYYPLYVKEPVAAPFHQQPGVDLITELAPVTVKDIRKLHYKLEKISKPDDIDAILSRTDQLSEKSGRISALRQKRDEGRTSVKLPLGTKKPLDEKKDKDKPEDPQKPESEPKPASDTAKASSAGLEPELDEK